MATTSGIRFANTFLDIQNQAKAVLDEMMINKLDGRLFYKTLDGEIVDLFERHASKIDESNLQDRLNEILRLAKEYADNAVLENPGGGTGSSTKLVHYIYNITSYGGQTHFDIPLSTFDVDRDLVLFTTNTVMPDGGFVIQNKQLIFDEGLDEGTVIRFIILKNVPVSTEEGSVSASVLEDGTITEDKLSPELLQKIMSGSGGGSSNVIVSNEQPTIQGTGGVWIEIPKTT